MSESNVVTADRLARRRSNILIASAMAFMASQGVFFSKIAEWDRAGGLGTIDAVQILAWFAMAAGLLVLLFTGGGWFRSPKVRALLNDESSRANRRKALSIAFANTMLMGFAISFLTLFKPVSGRETVYLMMTIGIASALLAFGTAERTALRDG